MPISQSRARNPGRHPAGAGGARGGVKGGPVVAGVDQGADVPYNGSVSEFVMCINKRKDYDSNNGCRPDH